jgi:phage terminase small subunit
MAQEITKTQTTCSLNDKQELFCQLYASDKEFFANGTQSYINAYQVNMSAPGAYKSSMASACRLLSNVKILERINELLELRGLNAPFVDKQLEFLITQNADFGSKIRAIQEYNQLQQRISKIPQVAIQINNVVATHEMKKETILEYIQSSFTEEEKQELKGKL